MTLDEIKFITSRGMGFKFNKCNEKIRCEWVKFL